MRTGAHKHVTTEEVHATPSDVHILISLQFLIGTAGPKVEKLLIIILW